MDLNLQPLKVTKELILSKIPEEQLMEHYLGVPVKKGLFKSPLRRDNNPTCAFYRNKSGRIILKDFRGDFSGDFLAVVMYKFNCSFYSALQIVANDFNLITRPDLKKNKQKMEYSGNKFSESKSAIIQVEIRDFNEKELAWWNSYGIKLSTLQKFKVFPCKHVFLNGNLFYSESEHQFTFGYYGGIKDDIEQWRIYFPGKKRYKFISNWKSTRIQGSLQLPKENGDVLVITKSMKDCMCLYEYGITAIAPVSENVFITDKQYQKLKQRYKTIVCFFDNDAAGISNMRKIKKQYPDVIPIWIPRKCDTKDFSDFRKKYGHKHTLSLIEYAKQYINGKKEKQIVLENEGT